MREEVSDVYQLDWQGPFIFQGEGDLLLNSPMAKQSGIYLFTVKYKDGYLIQYAGLTNRTFRKRFQEHIRAYRNGVYTILDSESLQKGERVVIWRGFWSKFSRRTLEINKELNYEFESRCQEIKYATEKLLSAYRIFLAPLNTERRMLARIEASIMNILYSKSGVVSALPDRGMALAPRWDNEKIILVHSFSESSLYGLPNAFEV